LKQLEKNHEAVLSRVAEACAACGRDPAEVRVVAVTKKVTPEVAHALARLGAVDLGENRVPEFERKVAWFRDRDASVRWHFIGHVQRNKARRVLKLADEIHSVDSPRLLTTLARLADEEGRRPGIYLQARLTAEDQKYGLAPDALPELVEEARAARLPLLGLMVMAPPLKRGAELGRPLEVFERLRALAEALPPAAFRDGRPLLSMGMSDDLEDAVRAGSHLVRVGTAFFEGVPSPPVERTGAGGGA